MGLLPQCPGARRVNFDFCMLGMRSEDENGVALAKKRTTIVANLLSLVSALSQHQCNGEHRHVTLINGRAKACEEYPDKFCEVVLSAMREDLGAVMSLVGTSTGSAGDDPWLRNRRMASAECDEVRGAIDVHADEPAGETSRATCRGNIDVTKEFEALTEALNG